MRPTYIRKLASEQHLPDPMKGFSALFFWFWTKFCTSFILFLFRATKIWCNKSCSTTRHRGEIFLPLIRKKPHFSISSTNYLSNIQQTLQGNVSISLNLFRENLDLLSNQFLIVFNRKQQLANLKSLIKLQDSVQIKQCGEFCCMKS